MSMPAAFNWLSFADGERILRFNYRTVAIVKADGRYVLYDKTQGDLHLQAESPAAAVALVEAWIHALPGLP